MKKNLNSKVVLIIAVMLVCIYGIIGIPGGFTGKDLTAALTKHIHLGLDLQGGAHLILQVEVKEAVNTETDAARGRIEKDLKDANLTVAQVIKPDPNNPQIIRVVGTAQTKGADVRPLLDSKYDNQYDITSSGADNTWTLTMKPTVLNDLQEKTVQQAIETIRDRVDELGVAEPQIEEYKLGANQILVELPGVDDFDKIAGIIKNTSRLEVHAVIGGPYTTEQEALGASGGALPSDQIMQHYSGVAGSGTDSIYVLSRAPIVSGTDFRSADSGQDQAGRPAVHFTLTNEAGDRFYDYTSKNVGHSMAVILSGRVREVANIESAIRDQGEIHGSFTKEEVDTISKMLRTGALPASLTQLETRMVGASLGADSIKQGVTAAIVGVLVVMAFMLVYYRGSGINADLALILNLVILLGFMGFSGATLTLPGIAGVILTIGMGVDSNVLIFERIREELRAGKVPSAAVEQGFGHAWLTIVDTHVTTIVSAAILIIFGTGPVKGFAVTLIVGLLANLFSAVFVSRVIFDAHLNKKQPGEALSI
jgi:preprotein translocase subunit SecD